MTKLYSFVENNIVLSEPGPLPFSHGNIIGFCNLTDDEELKSYGYYPAINSEYEGTIEPNQILEKTFILIDGIVQPSFNIRNANSFETEMAERKARNTRDSKLARSDWTQLPDNSLNDLARAAWKKYRQDLRDVTSQVGFPWTISWPTEPTEPYDGIVPDSITRYQAKAQLSDTFVDINGDSVDALTVIEQTIAAQSKSVQIAFNEASVWFRNSPMVLQLAAQFSVMFGWTDTDIDNMFRAAALRTA